MQKYEVALVNKDGTIERGGIPTSKAHAQRWANENTASLSNIKPKRSNDRQPWDDRHGSDDGRSIYRKGLI